MKKSVLAAALMLSLALAGCAGEKAETTAETAAETETEPVAE